MGEGFGQMAAWRYRRRRTDGADQLGQHRHRLPCRRSQPDGRDRPLAVAARRRHRRPSRLSAICRVLAAARSNGTSDEIVNDIVYQVGALREFASRHGAKLQHVKPHGALYMELAGNEALVALLHRANARRSRPMPSIFCMGMSADLPRRTGGRPAGHPRILRRPRL